MTHPLKATEKFQSKVVDGIDEVLHNLISLLLTNKTIRQRGIASGKAVLAEQVL